jgi:hypothetical protein
MMLFSTPVSQSERENERVKFLNANKQKQVSVAKVARSKVALVAAAGCRTIWSGGKGVGFHSRTDLQAEQAREAPKCL